MIGASVCTRRSAGVGGATILRRRRGRQPQERSGRSSEVTQIAENSAFDLAELSARRQTCGAKAEVSGRASTAKEEANLRNYQIDDRRDLIKGAKATMSYPS
jgi:hypothetical protein